MDTDINDIWDLPVEETIVHLSVNAPDGDRPSSSSIPASNHPLFLPSDDEEDAPAAATAPTTNARPKGNGNPDIDALFEGLDDMDDSIQELAPALDLDALRREADARNTRAVRAEMAAIIPTAALSADAIATKTNGKKGGGPLDGVDGEGDADDDGKKKRKPIPKLDETRLLGKNGFLQLVKDTKHFKPKGKGHEVNFSSFILSLPTWLVHLLINETPTHYPGNGLGSRAPGVPILDAQTVSQNSIQGDRGQAREALPLKAHAGVLLDPLSR
jgi:replication fork protection complex subunit Csm3/Swi3